MKTPLHLWIVGVLSLLWNAFGAYNHVMTQFRNAQYLSVFKPEQMAYFDNAPVWFDAVWATGVWFSVLGAILLLLRSRLARSAFGVSLLGLAASPVYSFGLAEPSTIDMMGSFALVFTGVIVVILVALWLCARAMVTRGVLR